MFVTVNKNARKLFLGRRLGKGQVGANIFYSVPTKKSAKRAKRLTIKVGNSKVELSGRDVVELTKMLAAAPLMQA